MNELKTKDFSFELPEKLIAQRPLEDRSASRMLMLDKFGGDIRHGRFIDILEEIAAGDCIVLNETKVIPARLIGTRGESKVEILLLRRLDENRWETLASPGKRTKPGHEINFGGVMKAIVENVKDNGNRIVTFEYEGIFEERLDELGEMPLPPYIKERLEDSSRYQTVYAKHDGSAAAPTAGLHFTEALLSVLEEKGVNIARVTLHVGLGTFRPVKVENIRDHEMHSEFYSIEETQAEIINSAKDAGGRIIAVGTTTCRTLEACADDNGHLVPGSGWTDIFIYPGYRFKIVDGLITNFHLPGSTLIMLVSALSTREHILKAYMEAIEREYRFYSFGDCMAIL